MTEDQRRDIIAAINAGVEAIKPPFGIYTPEDYNAVLSSVADDHGQPYDAVWQVWVDMNVMGGG